MKQKKDKRLNSGSVQGSERVVRSSAVPYGPGAKYFDLVNELLSTATPMGAYCVGLVSAVAWQQGLDPDETELRYAVRCSNLKHISRFLAKSARFSVPEAHQYDTRTSSPNPADSPNSNPKEPL
jgi:hypothetical protein